ncbi:transketolase [Terrimicrobium sacchariphilum]|uniref:Transketolase n=1 Tax=Terrimicrobium sacchariphilum TaxID=690879 RepID=A0A146G991_TERSA|nr:transketolase [Terrimicrobium sacchariphilum]GAT33842.1 transketolase [Terrimicrobium sacchariphilum]
MSLNIPALEIAARDARGLAMDAVAACKSGHLGLPLGAAEIGAVLYGHALSINPDEPRWLNRDRFILSAGHGSMFLYSWLHLAGFGVSLEDVKSFRKLHSITPGHPEFHETPGVESTTGPLGQGVSNGLGYAISAKMCEAHFNTGEHKIFDHHVVVLAGDGCLQEGVAQEASALAAHLGLDNLILFYDSNNVTLDALAPVSQSEDTAAKYRAYGWDVYEIDGHNFLEILETFEKAKAATSGKPQFIVAKTLIGKGIPEVSGTNKAHGEAGVKFIAEARKGLGLPEGSFFVAEETRTYFAQLKETRKAAYNEWVKTYEAWREGNKDLAAQLDAALEGKTPDLLSVIPEFDPASNIATRKAGSDVLQPIAQAMPLVISGSADLHGSTLNYIKDGGDFSRQNREGRNLHFGIREHAMCGLLNGIAYDGIFRPSGATFLVFSDYGRPSIRVAALSKLPVVYIFTHDSVGVGEDGPTHEPVETVAALRAIPGLDVIRPADPEETAGAFAAAFENLHGPTMLILSRQNLPTLNEIPVKTRREGVLKGGYIARKETAELEYILLSTGSELQHALKAADELGAGTRVVSLPSFSRFDAQSDEYKESVLPKAVRKRVSIEAGISQPWFKYVGLDGKTVAIDRFGLSAPGATVMELLGMTAAKVVEAAKSL